MKNEVDLSKFVKVIAELAKDKYQIDSTGVFVEKILSLAPKQLEDKRVIRLQRISTGSNNWRTFLMAVLDSQDEVNLVLQWAADTKDELLDPESADLYLIAAIKDSNFSVDQCINIESGEQFCRKYILRPGETESDLVNRTFLGSLKGEVTKEEISDPLLGALARAGSEKEWFNAAEQAHWHEAFLSGKTGAELVDLLFADVKSEKEK